MSDKSGEVINVKTTQYPPVVKERVGIDIFLHARDASPDDLAARLGQVAGDMELNMISNRGQGGQDLTRKNLEQALPTSSIPSR